MSAAPNVWNETHVSWILQVGLCRRDVTESVDDWDDDEGNADVPPEGIDQDQTKGRRYFFLVRSGIRSYPVQCKYMMKLTSSLPRVS